MPRLILLCIQIICFCLAWALITFEIQPFLGVWKLITASQSDAAPQWTLHTTYLFSIILIVTGISATIRLKVLSHFTSISITFLIILWVCFALQPEQYLAYLLKYSYIVLIPIIFHKIFTQNIRNIEKIIKATIQISLLYIPYNIGWFLFTKTNLSEPFAIILTSTFTLMAVAASLGLYLKSYFTFALKVSGLVFTIGVVVDVLPISNHLEFNKIPMAIIGISLVIFTRWVRDLSIGD